MANNFSADPNCKALWKFNNGALTTDSIGGNTLTDNNTVGTDTVNFMEGDASADFESANSEYFSRTDADLSAGFPLKSGDTNKVISVCAWFRLESFASIRSTIASKLDTVSDKRSFALRVMKVDPNRFIELTIGYNNGSSAENILHDYPLSTGTWYHVTGVFRDTDRKVYIYLKDINGNQLGTNNDQTSVNNIFVTDIDFKVGALSTTPTNLHDGLIDELVVFNDVITAEEATQIAKGVYGVGCSIIRPIYDSNMFDMRGVG